MKVRVNQATLNEAVAWAVRSVPLRPSLPVLAGLHLQAVDEQLIISAVDYESSTRAMIDAEVMEPGTVVVSGRLLADIVRSLPGDSADITCEDTRVTITSQRSRFVMLTLPVQDYLEAPTLPPVCGQVSGAVLAKTISQVSVAASRDDSLLVLTGIRLELEGEELTAVATDRYRLAMKQVDWQPASPQTSTQVLIPAKMATDAAKAFAGVSQVSVALSTDGQEAVLGLEGEGRRMTTRLLGGQFPASYRSLFPSQTSSRLVVRTEVLLEATRRVALVAQRTSPLRLTVTADSVVLEAGRGDDAQAVESISALLEGEPIQMAFNHTYLVDGLVALGTPFAQITFADPSKPAVLMGCQAADGQPGEPANPQPESESFAAQAHVVDQPVQAQQVGPAQESFRYLLMPIRLS